MLITTTPPPSPAAWMTVKDNSPYRWRSCKTRIPIPPSTAMRIAISIGKSPAAMPIATPPKLTWAKASPSGAVRRRTTNTPRTPQTVAITRPAISARCMNPNWKMLNRSFAMGTP